MKDTIQEHGDATFTVLTEASWAKTLDAVMAEGRQAAKQEADEGHVFEVAVLAPHAIRGGGPVPLSGAVLELNWKLVGTSKNSLLSVCGDNPGRVYKTGFRCDIA